MHRSAGKESTGILVHTRQGDCRFSYKGSHEEAGTIQAGAFNPDHAFQL